MGYRRMGPAYVETAEHFCLAGRKRRGATWIATRDFARVGPCEDGFSSRDAMHRHQEIGIASNTSGTGSDYPHPIVRRWIVCQDERADGWPDRPQPVQHHRLDAVVKDDKPRRCSRGGPFDHDVGILSANKLKSIIP